VRERGELVDQDLRLGIGDRAAHRVRIERVQHHRLGSLRAQILGAAGVARGADDRVPLGEQARDQRPSDRARRPGQEDPHGDPPLAAMGRS